MNKKRLNFAVLVSGIDEEYQSSIIEGIQSYASVHQIDLSHFIAFGGSLGNQKHDEGEFNIFRLANLRLFDGVILMTNTISAVNAVDEIIAQMQQAEDIPAVCIDNDLENMYSICSDNKGAMREMVEHFITHHHFTRLNYISGPENNPESKLRLQAYKETLTAFGIPVEEERIYHGSFVSKDGKLAVEEFLKSSLPFPEAIICANDVMAISAMLTLNQHDISVPEQVMVSGFDNTYNARNYSPELTSVHRPLVQTGELACELLLQHINGNPQKRKHTLSMTPLYTESCGCPGRYSSDVEEFKKRNYQILESNSIDITMLNRMSCALVECDNFYDYVAVMKRFALETGCREFYLCLCENWHTKLESDSNCLEDAEHAPETTTGYTNQMIVPLAYADGQFFCHDSFSVAEVLPDMKTPTDYCRSLYFVPLHFRERCLGYFVIGNTDFPIRSSMFHSWSMQISNSLENIRKIVCLDEVVQELDRLYAIDALTGIFNRNGFQRETESSFRNCIEKQLPVLVMFIDMDGLKLVNDNNGHKAGDIAIHKTAEILKENCRRDEICCRFGGDEFIVFGADYTEEAAQELIANIRKDLDRYNEKNIQPFTLNISIGYHIAVPTEDTSLFQMITVSDKIMYEQKRKRHVSKYLKQPNGTGETK